METSSPHVIIVEDQPEILELSSAILGHNGYRVSAFTNPLEAAKAIAAGDVDLVVTDLVMPEARGDVLCMTSNETAHGTPVLFVTGLPEKVPNWCKNLGPHVEILRKPFSAQTLLLACEHLIAMYHAAQPDRSAPALK